METDVDPIAPVSHLAIVMDGNGRWAQQRNLPRQEGHAAGVETVRRAVRFIADAGIDCLTLFSFSTENWQRPSGEVKFLMRLLKHYIEADLAELHKNDVRVKIIGKRQGLDAQLVKLIEHAEQVTAANTGMRLQIAFNYGAREEIAEAAARLAARSTRSTSSPQDFDSGFGPLLRSSAAPTRRRRSSCSRRAAAGRMRVSSK